MMTLDSIVRECRTIYTLRYVADRWRVYRGTTPILSYLDPKEALAALRELQGIEIVESDRRFGQPHYGHDHD